MQKVVLLGCGFMGKMHAQVYDLLENAELVAVVDRNPERASRLSEKHQVPSFQSLEEANSSVSCTVVDVCLPTFQHADSTVLAASLGKHIICEKPMALNVSDADKMIAACEAAHVRLMIAHCIRFWPEYIFLKELVQQKRFGTLLSLNLTRYGEFPTWSSENWLADESKSGGGSLDMHIHDTDYALSLFGTEPKSMESFGTVDDRGVSQIFTTMQFPEAVIHLEGGWNLPPKTPFKMAFRAIFEKGAAIFDGGPLTLFSASGEPEQPSMNTINAEGGGNISDLGGYFNELEYFVNCLEYDLPFEECTPQSSRESLRVTLQEISAVKSRMGR